MNSANMYDSPSQFEPLIPFLIPPSLTHKASDIVLSSTQLGAAAHPSARAAVRELVRSMNSYYSNRIEGQGTHPLNIERALRHEFSDKPAVARLQRVALAHIAAERALEERLTAGESAMSSRFLLSAHQALYSRLAEEDRSTDDGHIIVPGELRRDDVEVGRHIPPTAASLPLYHVFASGPATRREFAQMTGLQERTARSLLSCLLATGLLQSDTPLGPVRFGLPLDALQFLLPELYPEAATKLE